MSTMIKCVRFVILNSIELRNVISGVQTLVCKNAENKIAALLQVKT